jgi:hypothetical protein
MPTVFDHDYVLEQQEWTSSELPQGLNSSCRALLQLLFQSDALSVEDQRKINHMRTTRATEVCDPDLRAQVDSEYAYETALDSATYSMAANILLAAFDDSLPPDIHAKCLEVSTPSIVETTRTQIPQMWVRTWEY